MKKFKFLSENVILANFEKWTKNSLVLANHYKNDPSRNCLSKGGFIYVLVDALYSESNGISKCKVMTYADENAECDLRITFSIRFGDEGAIITNHLIENGQF